MSSRDSVPFRQAKLEGFIDSEYDIVARVTDVTYRVRKVEGHSRRSKIVHLKNLRLYQSKEERDEKEATAGGRESGPQGEKEERVQPMLKEVVETEPDIQGVVAEEEVTWVESGGEKSFKVADVPEERRYQCFHGEVSQTSGVDGEVIRSQLYQIRLEMDAWRML